MNRLAAYAAVFTIAFFSACGGGGSAVPSAATGSTVAAASPSPSPAPSAAAQATAGPVHGFNPALTDANITTDTLLTRTYAPSSSNDNGTLLLFLPGQGAAPGAYITLSTFAASLGYHVVAIDYPDENAPSTFCGTDVTACDFGVYLQKWDGRAGPDAITPSNSIENRVTKLIPYLAAQYPAEGWAKFFSGTSVTWSNTVLAGHSLGSAMAAAIAKVVTVKRVALFAGPEDGITYPNGSTTPGQWLSQAGLTPVSAHYMFYHLQDTFFLQILANATALGLDAYGPYTSVDGAAPPYGNSHELTTNVSTSDPHHAVAFDGGIPLDASGNPIYVAAWKYLFGP